MLLPSLEFLSGVEETVVRERAVQSLNIVSKLLSDNDIVNKYVPMVKRIEDFYEILLKDP